MIVHMKWTTHSSILTRHNVACSCVHMAQKTKEYIVLDVQVNMTFQSGSPHNRKVRLFVSNDNSLIILLSR